MAAFVPAITESFAASRLAQAAQRLSVLSGSPSPINDWPGKYHPDTLAGK